MYPGEEFVERAADFLRREYAVAFLVDELLDEVVGVSCSLHGERVIECRGGRHERIAGVVQGQQRPQQFAARCVPARDVRCGARD